MKSFVVMVCAALLLNGAALSARVKDSAQVFDDPCCWYVSVGGGAQLFYNNELYNSARYNGYKPAVKLEIGRQVIPALSLSLCLYGSPVTSKTNYPYNPYVDWTGIEENPASHKLDYMPYDFNMVAAMVCATMDWTSFILGYERARRQAVHFTVPVALGAAAGFGEHVNPAPECPGGISVAPCANIGLGLDIRAARWLTVAPVVCLGGAWGNLDDFRQGGTWLLDWFPNATLSMRFNFARRISFAGPVRSH